ncbi:MAG: DEAD/DEAH box helicase [Niameybacter sp.]
MALIASIRPQGFQIDFKSTSKKDEKKSAFEETIYQTYQENPYHALYILGTTYTGGEISVSIGFLHSLSKAFLTAIAKNPEIEQLREKACITLGEEAVAKLLREAPYMNGTEYLDAQWIEHIVAKLDEIFAREISEFKGSVEEYLANQKASIHTVGRVFFHLVESKKEEYPFAFLATYAEEAEIKGKSKHVPLKHALVQYKNDSEKLLNLLATVNKASIRSTFISGLMESGEIFHPIAFNEQDAYTFLKEIPIYEESGILCRMPNWWKQRSNNLRLSLKVGEKTPSKVGQEALMDFDLRLSMGEEVLSPEEIEQLLRESEGLTLLKGKWVEVDHKKLEQVLEAFEEARNITQQEDMTILEVMKLQLNTQKLVDINEDICEVEISNGEWLTQTLSNLTRPENLEDIETGPNFHATLRAYQQKGLSWLYYMKQLGLGACLADDMGLGKTIQIIALLNHIRKQYSAKTLLVVPASLMGNWEREITRFAPSIKYHILHPSGAGAKTKKEWTREQQETLLAGHEVFITTYSMLLKYEWLNEMKWDLLILDEAQAIKNAGTKQSKAAKQIQTRFKIAMTGTPIENSLSDLWSLFDFLNPGLLGTPKEFKAFMKKLGQNPAYNTRLKQVVSPFILRRLKTDKTVISDLPDKIEMKTFATLTKKQAVLYNRLLKELTQKLESSEGIERKGLILASLMKFKQICNHPDQYLGQEEYTESESGKYARLREICETIYEKRERVLIFTQFKEMTEPISQFLETIFEHKGLVLHGGTPVAKRQQLVEKFQGEDYIPFMVLSLKAGGVGLNLTAANHVVHFDRWWNPAIENQATDRAFRIGQEKNVIVHKFVTQGTIEEKIDEMIESKNSLARQIIPEAQENWITEMNNEELLSLFKLSL